MDGLALIREAEAAGLNVRVDGDKLVIRGPRLAESIARRLIAHKPKVLAALRRPRTPAVPVGTIADEATDWRELFNERAAMRQFKAGYGRRMAERLAWGECVEAWCEQHPALHAPTRCAGCGGVLGREVLDLPDGARVHWQANREFLCLVAYGDARRRRAVAALAALGLQPPIEWGT
jgi:hypothetical protein